ncbi:iron-sulfur cluster assembly accessory protein [Neofusicoccum parvum]|uniref:Iron-sulfur assembly protein 1 n=2 Tax=Neofusicoccum parvum TaxID=310453 RepID=R1GE75_BOTPV|nr:putative iron-sulfur cluster assembly accessory protein [Neofusicoccum parvum UCRNP2]GME24108.1 iron-sulfur cluster assembly accessory protein [Neofusicoccum parvum]GME50025.1 iron-sulfur cluster assembly accessory protein [Neofusicoccum parvum]
MSSARQTRHLQTASAYQPHHLQPPPAPPRNSGIPDASLGGKPEVNETRPPRLTEQRGSHVAASTDKKSSISVMEGEAQKSQLAFNTAPAPAPAPSKRPSRFKFKAKKAAMTLTPSAVSALRELLDSPDPKLIRVGTKNKGCSGLAYHLEYVDKPGKFDDAVEQDGVKVLIDSKALIHILGSEMDWVEDKLSRRFVFRNPNITESCGCGESFSVN